MSWKDKFPKENRYFETPNGILYQGHVLDILKEFPDESVNCIITSPPYWGLRDYGGEANTIWDGDPNCEHEFDIENSVIERGAINPEKNTLWRVGENQSYYKKKRIVKSGFCKKCGAWYGQLGLEPSLDMYINHLLQITAELKRVLRKDGVMFWNHGDSYSGNMGKRSGWSYVSGLGNKKDGTAINFKPRYNVPQKSMCMQNYRLVMRMVDEQGFILRNIIIWHKPNHMPSSAKDRFTNAYEPVFMLVKNKKYWFDLDAVRVPSKTGNGVSQGIASGKRFGGLSQATTPVSGFGERELKNHPLGKNPGDVWEIPTQPFPEAHFAVYPPKLVEPMIKAGCPKWVCKKCGKPRERITETKLLNRNENLVPSIVSSVKVSRAGDSIHQTIGWTDCGCNAGWKTGIVLDPFMGSGTTALVAEQLNRRWIGIEINPRYCDIIVKRLKSYASQDRLTRWLNE